MYLGKPTLMIPVPKHYEQACNAIDAKRAGAGITGTSFDLSEFINYLPTHKDISRQFKTWHDRGNFIFLREIENLFNAPERHTMRTTFSRLDVVPQLIKRFALALLSPSTRN